MSLRAVLLDLDGTLVDSVPDLAYAVNAMRVDLGLTPLRDDVIATYVGKGIENLVHRSLSGSLDGEAEAARFPEALASFKHAYHIVNGEKARLFDGVIEGLQAMRKLGLKLAVVTNKAEEFTIPLLTNIGLRSFFDVIVSGDTVARKKPDPQPMLHACELLGVQPSEAVVIGDSMNDASSGKAAGCRVLLVPYGYNEGRDVRSLDVDGIVPTLIEAAAWIAPRVVQQLTDAEPLPLMFR
jgi:phosphoglycolate phosphatase